LAEDVEEEEDVTIEPIEPEEPEPDLAVEPGPGHIVTTPLPITTTSNTNAQPLITHATNAAPVSAPISDAPTNTNVESTIRWGDAKSIELSDLNELDNLELGLDSSELKKEKEEDPFDLDIEQL
jgi:hypothetical protein